MPLTEMQEYDITVRASGHIEVRRSDCICKDDIVVARTYHRHVVTPGDDVSNEIQKVQDIANAVWTEQLIQEAQNNVSI